MDAFLLYRIRKKRGGNDVAIRCGKNDVCHMISVKGFELCCWENNAEYISEE